MNHKGYGLSDAGNNRKSNEDFFLIDSELSLFIVCDGVSGHPGGAMASETCAREIQNFIRKNHLIVQNTNSNPTPETYSKCMHLILSAIQAANKLIHSHPNHEAQTQDACTTVEVLLLTKTYAFLGHVGDSRIYLIREGRIHQLTEDHQFSTEMIKQGLWSEKESRNSPYSNLLSKAVGSHTYIQPDITQLEISAGDLFLLCTDGLSNDLKSTEILRCLKSNRFETVPNELIKAAKFKGGTDNLTALLVQIENKVLEHTPLDILKKGNLLGKIPLFKYLTYPELLKILNIVKIKSLDKGVEWVKEGDSGSNEMFIIAQGTVEVLKKGQQVTQRQVGETIGEMALLDNSKRSATLRTLEPTLLLELSRESLFQLMQRENLLTVKILWALTQELNKRLKTTTDELVEARGEIPFLEINVDEPI